MKIVQVANFYGPTSGGLRTAVDALGQGYERRGHERVLIVPGARDADEATPAGRRVTMRSPVLPGSGGYRVLTNLGAVADLLARERPASIEVSDKVLAPWIAGQGARIGARTVLLSHERLDAILRARVPWPGLLELGADRWNRRLLRVFDAVVCASAFSAEEFRRVGGAPSVVPLGVDLAGFRPATAPAVDEHVPLVVCVGRLSAEKAPDVAIAVVRELVRRRQPCRLVMVGGGPLEGRLRRQAEGLPVEFAGHVAAAEVARLLATASVAIAPCPVESFGLAVLEAMACGTPVVVADGGAAPELMTPQVGLAVPGEPVAMADGIVEVLGWPVADRRAAARRRAEAFSWDTTVAAMVALHHRRSTVAA